MRGVGYDMGMFERIRVDAARHQARKMRHIDEESRANFISDSAEPGEIDNARIGRAAGDDDRRAVLFGQSFDFVKVDQVGVCMHAILHSVEPFARHRGLGAVGQVTACIKAHAKYRVARLSQREHHRAIGLRA